MSKDPTIRELLEAILSKGPATIAEAVKLEAFREEVSKLHHGGCTGCYWINRNQRVCELCEYHKCNWELPDINAITRVMELEAKPATIAEAVKLEAFREEVIQEVLKRLEPRLEGFENVLDSHEESITALFNPEIKGE